MRYPAPSSARRFFRGAEPRPGLAERRGGAGRREPRPCSRRCVRLGSARRRCHRLGSAGLGCDRLGCDRLGSAPPHPAGSHCGAVAAPPSRADAGDQVCGGGRRVSAGGAAPAPNGPGGAEGRREGWPEPASLESCSAGGRPRAGRRGSVRPGSTRAWLGWGRAGAGGSGAGGPSRL